MADSATYTPETLQRRYAMAQALLADPKKPITHWAEGLNELAKGALGGYQMGNAERLEAKQRGDANAQVMAALGLGGPSAAVPPPGGPPAAGPMPAAPSGGPAPAPQVLGAGGAPAQPDAQGVYGADATMMPPGGGAPLPDFGKAIAGIESAGQKDPYAALGPTTRTGDRAYGKYQVMGANIPAWTKEHLGQEMTPQQFLASPEAQDAVFKGQFGKYVQQTGNPQDAASMWFSGKPLAQGAGLKDQLGTTGQQYVDKFNAGMGGPSGASPAIGAIASALNGGASGAPTAAAGAPPSPAVADVAKTLSAPAGSPAAQPAGPAGVGAVPNAKAIAAVLTSPWIDPSVKAHLMTQMMPDLKDAGTDPITGQRNYQPYNRMTGRPIPNPEGGATAPQSGMLAPGVTAVNHNLNGEDYLKQFGPEVQAAVKSYINGDVMPSGNPRQQAIAAQAKTIAQKYGADTGTPVSDALYTQKRNLVGEFGKGTASSLGGQRNSGNTAIGHLDTLSEQAADLGNVNLGGVLPSVAGWFNKAREEGTAGQKAKANALNNTLDRYVAEVGKFYSGSSSGGVAEREAARQRFNSTKTPEELAAAVASERDLFHSKLRQLEQQRDDVLGERGRSMVGDIISPKSKEALDRIDERIRAMRGEGTTAPAAQSGTAPTAPPAAAPKFPAVGEVRSGYRFKGGDPADKANWEQAQ